MMETTRRKFLGAMAAAPVAVPQMANTLTSGAAIGRGLPPFTKGVAGGELDKPYDPQDPWDLYRTIGIPEFVKDEIRKQSAPHMIEPKVAALRSVSDTAKHLIQRNLNYEREIENRMGWRRFSDMTTAFMKKHGLDYYS